MRPDLSNTQDVDPEGWLNKLSNDIPDWLDRFLADPGRVSDEHAATVVTLAKKLLLAMYDAMEVE